MNLSNTIKGIFIFELILVGLTFAIAALTKDAVGYGAMAFVVPLLLFWPLLVFNFILAIVYLFSTIKKNQDYDRLALAAGAGPFLFFLIYSLVRTVAIFSLS